jgi:hypothetical protein
MYPPAMVTSKQIRSVQRAIHLVAGLALVAYVYATPPAGSLTTTLVRVLVPVATMSGVAMWQWPRIRAALRHRGVRV